MLQSRVDGDEVGDGRTGDGGVGDMRSMLAGLGGWFMLEGSGCCVFGKGGGEMRSKISFCTGSVEGMSTECCEVVLGSVSSMTRQSVSCVSGSGAGQLEVGIELGLELGLGLALGEGVRVRIGVRVRVVVRGVTRVRLLRVGHRRVSGWD